MKYLIFLFFSLIIWFGRSQSTGYFGKKNLISINGIGNNPLIYNVLSNFFDEEIYFVNSSGTLNEGVDLLNGGFNLAFTRYSSKSFGYGLEFNMNFLNCKGPDNTTYYTYDQFGSYDAKELYFQHEKLNISTITFMPKIEFNSLNSTLPFGINNQLGLGYSNTKIRKNNYKSITYIDNQIEYDSQKIFNPNLKCHGFTFLYAVNVRVPINKSLLFNYGLRYTLNLTFDKTSQAGDFLGNENYPQIQYNQPYYVSDRDMRQLISRSRFMSLLALNIGFNFMF